MLGHELAVTPLTGTSPKHAVREPGAKPPSRRTMALRLAEIAALAGREALRAHPSAALVAATHARASGRRRLYRDLVRALTALGPTFVKFGQISATRADALPPELCRELSRLHDAVAPMAPAAAARAL